MSQNNEKTTPLLSPTLQTMLATGVCIGIIAFGGQLNKDGGNFAVQLTTTGIAIVIMLSRIAYLVEK